MNTAHSVHASCCCAISAHVLPLLCADAYRLRDKAVLHTKPTLKHVLTILCLACAHVTMLYGSDAAVVDESFVLPAVTALRGVLEVTEAGDVVYTFPELQVSCSHTTTANLHANTNTITTATTACFQLLGCSCHSVLLLVLLILATSYTRVLAQLWHCCTTARALYCYSPIQIASSATIATRTTLNARAVDTTTAVARASGIHSCSCNASVY
jgi:hypothetical protein